MTSYGRQINFAPKSIFPWFGGFPLVAEMRLRGVSRSRALNHSRQVARTLGHVTRPNLAMCDVKLPSGHRITTLSILFDVAFGTAPCFADSIELACGAVFTPSFQGTCAVVFVLPWSSVLIDALDPPPPTELMPTSHSTLKTSITSSSRPFDRTCQKHPPFRPRSSAAEATSPPQLANTQKETDTCDTGAASVSARSCRGVVRAPMLRRRKPRARILSNTT
jgi:hypothetical protein